MYSKEQILAMPVGEIERRIAEEREHIATLELLLNHYRNQSPLEAERLIAEANERIAKEQRLIERIQADLRNADSEESKTRKRLADSRTRLGFLESVKPVRQMLEVNEQMEAERRILEGRK